MTSWFAFGVGLATRNRRGEVLDVFFPAPLKHLASELGARLAAVIGQRDETDVDRLGLDRLASIAESGGQERAAAAWRALADAARPIVAVSLEHDVPIATTAQAYLKLHLLSHRLALPNSMNLEGIFAKLPNVAWTSDGPLDAADVNGAITAARRAGRTLLVHSVDKFPRMTDYVVPSGVRIADASRIRLGAYLGEGTTVMHEGFVNFNAGALGPNMVEGRISQGVLVREHSDLGGSSSTMGTLSGGGNITITIGQHCLIGANAGTGIPLGDRCTIEAGLYITAGTRIEVLDEHGAHVATVKARELAGQSDMLFIRNSANGRVECRTNRRAIELNEQLHAHN
jgi:2,3,4,5-tetrahydropyridine-2,6-dicarboxylate N-succinyltransferase